MQICWLSKFSRCCRSMYPILITNQKCKQACCHFPTPLDINNLLRTSCFLCQMFFYITNLVNNSYFKGIYSITYRCNGLLIIFFQRQDLRNSMHISSQKVDHLSSCTKTSLSWMQKMLNKHHFLMKWWICHRPKVSVLCSCDLQACKTSGYYIYSGNSMTRLPLGTKLVS